MSPMSAGARSLLTVITPVSLSHFSARYLVWRLMPSFPNTTVGQDNRVGLSHETIPGRSNRVATS